MPPAEQAGPVKAEVTLTLPARTASSRCPLAHAVHAPLCPPTKQGLSKLSYEESKFLGGDIAHTHLVKGLDFALLQKARAPLRPSLQPSLFCSSPSLSGV